MADTPDSASDPSWFASPGAADAQAQTTAQPVAATPPADASPGEQYGYHPKGFIDAAPEAFPVTPQVIEVYSHVVNEINQGIADGSINGDDKQKFLDLTEKYADIWDEYAQRSHTVVAQADTANLQPVADELKEFQANHPDAQQQIDAQSPSPDTLKDAIGIKADLMEANLETANTWTHNFLDADQIILNFTREAAEIRSHQDGADAEALGETLQKVDHLQTDIDTAHDAADAHLDKNIDAVETWRGEAEHFIDAVPHPNQTSEGYRDQPQVSVTIASPDAAGQTVYEAQSVTVVAYAAADDPHENMPFATAAADTDHGATHGAAADAHVDDSAVAAADTSTHAHDATAAATAVEETSA